MITFRLLTKDEIDVRVQSNTKDGAVLLLYKDARCDMNILDETVGVTGWQRSHDVVKGNLFCTVSIYDGEHGQWVSKQDVGIESNTESEKGEASDSFKRACFNWGIGRELYTAPFTYIQLHEDELEQKDGKLKIKNKVKFFVKEIEYTDKRISHLVIVDQNGTVRFNMNGKVTQPKKTKEVKETKEQPKAKSKYAMISELIKNSKYTIDAVVKSINKNYNKTNVNDLTDDEFNEFYTKLQDVIANETA